MRSERDNVGLERKGPSRCFLIKRFKIKGLRFGVTAASFMTMSTSVTLFLRFARHKITLGHHGSSTLAPEKATALMKYSARLNNCFNDLWQQFTCLPE